MPMKKRSPRVSVMLENILGCKWSLSILGLIQKGVVRPGQMKRSIEGLSTKVMNERLKKMQRFGIIRKKSYPVIPLKVEYSLSSFGRQFIQLLDHVDHLERKLGQTSKHSGSAK